MRRPQLLLGGALLALTSTLAMAQPEDLLPDIFNDPAPVRPAPAPTPTATTRPQQPSQPSNPGSPQVQSTSAPVVQDIPSATSQGDLPGIALPENFPSLEELEGMEEGEINELLGLRQKFDVPPAARRALSRIGVVSMDEGGFPSQALAGQPGALVRAAIEGTRGPLVSRWGHILLRRALTSRMEAPAGMAPAEFAALRASLLNRMGEGQMARALVQDVDGGNYSPALTAAAFDAYLSTGDLLGMCPVARLHPDHREGGEWILTKAICDAYLGEVRSAERRLQRALGTGEAAEIDVRLAQRFAGAAGDAGRAVNIEWDGVEELTPWRFGLARALGVEIPENLLSAAPPRLGVAQVRIPALSLPQRAGSADLAAQSGVLSSSAMVDLYSQLYASDQVDGEDRQSAERLREAYVASDPAARLAAMRSLWGPDANYGRMVLTAYAAARLPANEALGSDAGDIVSSMLAAGLDANAVRWAGVAEQGSQAWALIALASPGAAMVDEGALEDFVDNDSSSDARKSRFLLAGLAGLGRLESDVIAEYSDNLGVDFQRATAWSERIDQAGRYRNAALVSLLAGVGMQGDSWGRMTARHLYHIVSALNAAGLEAEARMIAAEAVARG